MPPHLMAPHSLHLSFAHSHNSHMGIFTKPLLILRTNQKLLMFMNLCAYMYTSTHLPFRGRQAGSWAWGGEGSKMPLPAPLGKTPETHVLKNAFSCSKNSYSILTGFPSFYVMLWVGLRMSFALPWGDQPFPRQRWAWQATAWAF